MRNVRGECECECDGSGAGADVDYAQRMRSRAGEVEDGFDEEFGLGARDEGVAGDAECEAVKLLRSGEVLQGLMRSAALSEGAELCACGYVERFVGVREEPCAITCEQMQQEGLGVAAGDVG